MIENQRLLETTAPSALLNKLQNSNYRLFITLDGDFSTEDETLLLCLNALGITATNESQMWYKDNATGVLWTNTASDTFYIDLQKNDCYLEHRPEDGTTQPKNIVMINRTTYGKVNDGINITVYDTITQKVIDSIGIDALHEYKLIR